MATYSLGHKEIVQLLLAKGADMIPKANGGETASTLALREGHKEIVQLLLARGVTEPPPSSTSASRFPLSMSNITMGSSSAGCRGRCR